MNQNQKKMTRDNLLEIGFKSISTYTINDSLIYSLGRNKYLSVGCVGTPNEMVFLYEKDNRDINDIITLRNYDYDGYTNIDTIKSMIDILKVC